VDNLVKVAIGILVRCSGESGTILVTRRPDHCLLGGYWEFPGGKIEPGETPQECLRREFLEEVGLAIRVGGALPLLEHDYPYGRVRLHPFWCTLEGECDANPVHHQVTEHRWVTPQELTSLRFPPANGPIIAAVVAGWPNWQEAVASQGMS